jgi:hypothetical protein
MPMPIPALEIVDYGAMAPPGRPAHARTKYLMNFDGYILVASTAAPAEHPFRFMVLAISSPRSGVRG